MNFDINVITTNAIVIVPIIVAIVEAIKLTGWVKDHFAPLVSIGIGIIIAFLSGHNSPDLTATILSGAVYGLMASGLYSGIRTTMVARAQKKQQQKNKQNNSYDPKEQNK